MTEKKRYVLSDFFWEVLDTKYDWLGNTEPFSKETIEEEDYLLIGRAKTQEDGEKICNLLNKLTDENEHYKSIFFELVETALTDKNCRELYCKGILDIFDKANSLNQAREMIKEHLK